uniref:Uncharacterized protein MANES_01G093400 n=1 Tax=Rhizophora mucronata TaxID=61149 RepID=A0A2P2P6Z1_RHIMU
MKSNHTWGSFFSMTYPTINHKKYRRAKQRSFMFYSVIKTYYNS